MSTDKDCIVTPIGTLKYAFLNKARDYDNNGQFKYSCTFVARGPEAEKLAEQVDATVQKLVGKPHAKLTHKLYDRVVDENGAESIEFKLKVNATGMGAGGTIRDRKPKFLQASGVPYDMEEPRIGSGTTARIQITPYAWPKDKPTGLQLQPSVVKVINLVEFRRRNDEPDEDMLGDESASTPTAPRESGQRTTDF